MNCYNCKQIMIDPKVCRYSGCLRTYCNDCCLINCECLNCRIFDVLNIGNIKFAKINKNQDKCQICNEDLTQLTIPYHRYECMIYCEFCNIKQQYIFYEQNKQQCLITNLERQNSTLNNNYNLKLKENEELINTLNKTKEINQSLENMKEQQDKIIRNQDEELKKLNLKFSFSNKIVLISFS